MSGSRTVAEAGICIKGGAIAVAVTAVLHFTIKLFLYLASFVA